MDISIFQICTISFFAYLSGLGVPWMLGLTGGFYTLGRPLVAGLIVGIILGDITQGILIGVAIQAVFLALVTPGGVALTEISYASYPTIAIAMTLDVSPELAATLSVMLGAVGLLFLNFTQTFNGMWNKGADQSAEEISINGIYKYSVVYPSLVVFVVRFFSTILIISLGTLFGDNLLSLLPPIVIDTMTVMGGILPAVGIAVLLATIIQTKINWIYYILGFILVSFLQLNILTVVFGGILFALFNYQIEISKSSKDSSIDDMEAEL